MNRKKYDSFLYYLEVYTLPYVSMYDMFFKHNLWNTNFLQVWEKLKCLRSQV